MKLSALDQLVQFFITYYIHFIIIIPLLIIIAITIIKRRKSPDTMTSTTSTTPPTTASVSINLSQLKKPFSLYQLLINANPEILNKMVSDHAPDREHIINEIKSFHKIKNFKAIDAKTMELTIENASGTEHTYRATREDERKNSKIISLKRLS